MAGAIAHANGHLTWANGAQSGQETMGELPRPVVICGPSGVGKGTLIGKLMKEFPDKFGFSVSHTTRKPRDKERDGEHYHFTTRDVMAREIQEGKFLESAEVHGNLYGTSWAAVEAVSHAGKICILDIDVQGAQSVKKSSLKALFIFIKPPAPEEEELEKRLRGRGTETEEQIQKRLRNARQELERAKDVALFDHILVNSDLDEAYANLKALLGLGTPAASPHANGTAKHHLVHQPEAGPAHSNSSNGSLALTLDGLSAVNGPCAPVDGSVLDLSKHGEEAPGTTSMYGLAKGVANHTTANGVTKHAKSIPAIYNQKMTLTPADTVGGSPRANGISPRANGISTS